MNSSPSLREDVAPGISLQLVLEQGIPLFTFNSVEQTALKMWADKVRQLMTEAPLDKPLLLIQDFSFSKAAMTPALRAHVKELTEYRPELMVYIAIIVPRTFLTQVIVLFARAMYRKNRVTRAFFNKHGALLWIQSVLKNG